MKNVINIIKFSKPLHKPIIIISVVILVQALLQQATPITLKFVVDELSAQINDGTGDYGRLVFLFGLILAINIINIVLNTVGQRMGDYISSRMSRYLTEIYYRKVFTLSQIYFDSELSGKMINQLVRGINSVTGFVGAATNFIFPAVLQAAFGIIVLSYFDWKIGLLALAVFPMYIAISRYSTKKWGEFQVEKNTHEDSVRGRIQEVVNNIKLVKTYNTQLREWGFVSDKYETINNIFDRQSKFYHLLNFFREFGLEIAFIIILFLIFRSTFLGDLTLGEMVLIIQIMNQLRWPLYGMSYILEQIQMAESDSKAFFEVLELEGKENFRTKSVGTMVKNPDIKLENVSFAYENGVAVMKNINLELHKNESVALVGHSGAGKTTLINLIMKLYEPTTGKIHLSGKDYSKVDHSWIRNHMALVFQDNELFSSTIRENVSYGASAVTDEEIWKALEQANADDFVRKFPEGLDSNIGERGVKLSGGQKQRIQIARAILHNKPILILDEATSSLDSKSEKLVQDALEKLFKDRLVIIIAHRFSTIQNVDRIVVLDGGEIVDSGKPEELAEREGVYSELLRYQVEGNKKLLNKYEIY